VSIGPFVRDRAGNFMNQNRNTVYGELTLQPDDRFRGTFVVAGLGHLVHPERSTGPGLFEITLNFNMSVAWGRSLADIIDRAQWCGHGDVAARRDKAAGRRPATSAHQLRAVSRALSPRSARTSRTPRPATNGNPIAGNLMNQNGRALRRATDLHDHDLHRGLQFVGDSLTR
jgi:hypothetical protein